MTEDIESPIETQSLDITKLESYLCVHNLLKRRVLTKTNNDFLTFVRYMAPDLVHDWKMGRHKSAWELANENGH